MLEFALAFLTFLAAHIVPAVSGVREWAIGAAGRRNYLLVYSGLSAVLLLWVISSAQRAPYLELWPPAPWRHTVPLLTMPLALALFGAAAAIPNPLSVSFGRISGPVQIDGVLAVTRHPILWALLLWSASHLIANGDLVAGMLFASLAIFSVQGMVALDRRARRRLGEAEWRALAGQTSVVPFAALPSRWRLIRFARSELLGALAGLVAYALVIGGLHETLFGVSPLWP